MNKKIKMFNQHCSQFITKEQRIRKYYYIDNETPYPCKLLIDISNDANGTGIVFSVKHKCNANYCR